MTGPYASVIGMEPAAAVRKFVSSRPSSYKVAEGNVQVRAVVVDIDDATGKARSIDRLTIQIGRASCRERVLMPV